jgi:hypothetical protein
MCRQRGVNYLWIKGEIVCGRMVLLRKAYKRKICTDRDSYNWVRSQLSVVRCPLRFGF